MATAKKATKKSSAKTGATPAKKAATMTPATKSATPKKAVAPKTAAARGKAATADKLAPGSRAPAFRLPSSEGRDIALSDYAGKNVVLYFYPKDDTPGCTREAQGFRDAAAQLAARNAVVLGVSKDSVESHCRFRDKYGLVFPLLSDRDGSVVEAYGAWGEKNMYGKKSMGIVRTTVVIDAAGRVSRVFPKVKVDGHVEQVLEALRA